MSKVMHPLRSMCRKAGVYVRIITKWSVDSGRPIERVHFIRTFGRAQSERAASLPPIGAEIPELIGAHRSLQQESLPGFTSDFLEDFKLLLLFDSLGHCAHPQMPAHGHNGGAQRAQVLRPVDAADEAPIDLHGIEGKAAQELESGVARPEIVHRHADANGLELSQT